MMKKLLVLPLLLLCVSCVAETDQQSAGTNAANSGSDAKEVAAETGNAELDFGDSSSSTLTGKAWKALEQKKYDDAIAYADRCVELFEKDAIEMQASLTEPMDTSDKEAVFAMWALNDVGTCYFIKGQALEKQDKASDATEAYQQLLDKVSFAQCWDANGWFWKPADAAEKQIKMLEFEVLDSE